MIMLCGRPVRDERGRPFVDDRSHSALAFAFRLEVFMVGRRGLSLLTWRLPSCSLG
jgi:hypothetical protein